MAAVMPRATLEATLAENPFVPHLPTGPQISFLELECLEALYGGAAGGGKSAALLMAALQFATVPGYSALLMRRTFADLKLPGALIDRSHEWLSGTGARYNSQEHRWRFPAGATLQFGYCDNEDDVHRYQSSEFQMIGIDEAGQFTERQITYLFSRLRRRWDIPVPMRYRLASNPGGPGHLFLRGRFVDAGREDDCVFVPALLADNPYIDEAQYRLALAKLDPVTRARLERGDWDAVAAGRFKREHFRYYRIVHGEYYVLEPDGSVRERVRPETCWRMTTVDPAATSEETAKKGGDPDYTVVSTFDVTPSGCLVWVDCFRFRLEIPDIVPQVQAAYAQHRPRFVAIEAVASNRAVLQEAMRKRMVVREVSPRGKDKLVRARPAMIMAQNGKLLLPERAHWLDDVRTELLLFSGDGKTHDDCVDCASYACALIDEGGEGGSVGRPIMLSGRGQR